jgi:hypothetical protein
VAEYDALGNHVKMSQAASGALSMQVTGPGGTTHSYAVRIDEHGKPVVDTVVLPPGKKPEEDAEHEPKKPAAPQPTPAPQPAPSAQLAEPARPSQSAPPPGMEGATTGQVPGVAPTGPPAVAPPEPKAGPAPTAPKQNPSGGTLAESGPA